MNKACFIKYVFPVILLAMFSGNAIASLITFTHESNGSGSINGIAFTDTNFVITAVGHTENRQLREVTSTWFIDHDLASIDISGVGTFDFVTNTRTFVSNSISLVGFSHAGESGADLLSGPRNDAAFSTWDMLTSIGPVSGFAILAQWEVSEVVTTGGVLVFNAGGSGGPPVTFTAVVSEVPVPAAVWLFCSGIIGLIGIARRK